MVKENRQIIGKHYFRAKFDSSSINADKRTIDVVFVTENQVMMYNWDLGWFYEVLPCNDEAGDLSRLNNGAPLCDTHDTSSVKNGLGVVVKAWFDNGVGRATVRFSKRADVEPVWQDVQDGIVTGVSVSYAPLEYEEVGVKDNLPLVRTNKWEALEISLALVQADADSGVGRSATDQVKQDVVFIRKNSNINTMTEAEKAALSAERKRSAEILKACRTAKLSADYAQELIESEMTLEECRSAILEKAKETSPAAPATDDARSEGARNERTRISEITKAIRATGLPPEFGQGLIDAGTSLDEARASIIDESARKQPQISNMQTGVKPGLDEKDKKQRGMEASIMHRSGIMPVDKAGEPGEYRGMTLMDLAKECLTGANVEWRGMSQMEIANRALQMHRDGGGASTGDFAYVLQNVLNKTLRTMYDLQSKTFTAFCRKSTATDFKNMLRTQLNDLKIQSISQGGEYKFATVGDSGETYHVAKYGQIVNINWEAIVNDDLSAFSRYPTLLSGAVCQNQCDLVYAILTGSHKMFDGYELFDATNHGNYTTPGTAISVASLGVGRKQMRQQKSPGGNFLNIAPKYIVGGPVNEALMLQYTSQNYVATKSGDINVWVGMMQPIVDARITDTTWLLIADPLLIDTIEYAVLDGQEIYTETRYGFDVDALQWKVRSVFGAKAIDWRSMYKNAGA